VTVIGCSKMGSSTTGKYKNHKTLADFGYAFNEQGELRDVKSAKPFTFVDQEHYEALGEVITDEVYKLLEDKAGLEKQYLDNNKNSFIFVTPDYSDKDSLLCLIHGSGVVRAGQWARKLIINNDINKGTQLPYIEEAKKLGLGVVVFNTNQNSFIDEDNVKRKLAGSSTPEEHALTVWNNFVKPSKAEKIVLVAHSYGGVVTMALANGASQDFIDRVKGIYFTDSVHYGLTRDKSVNEHLIQIGENYITSSKPLGEMLKKSSSDVAHYSAGHTVHEWTSWSAQDTIFNQIKQVLNNQTYNGDNKKEEKTEL